MDLKSSFLVPIWTWLSYGFFVDDSGVQLAERSRVLRQRRLRKLQKKMTRCQHQMQKIHQELESLSLAEERNPLIVHGSKAKTKVTPVMSAADPGFTVGGEAPHKWAARQRMGTFRVDTMGRRRMMSVAGHVVEALQEHQEEFMSEVEAAKQAARQKHEQRLIEKKATHQRQEAKRREKQAADKRKDAADCAVAGDAVAEV